MSTPRIVTLVAVVAALSLTTCATAEDKRFAVGESENGFVILGVAEQAGAAQEATYTMLWRRVDDAMQETRRRRNAGARSERRRMDETLPVMQALVTMVSHDHDAVEPEHVCRIGRTPPSYRPNDRDS